MIMSESNKGTGTTNRDIGRLFRLNRLNGTTKKLSDVGDQQWRWTKFHPNPAEPNPDSNPYGVLITRMGGKVRTFVADAGANTISEVMPRAWTRVVSFIPNDTRKHDSTPTCIAEGPDGMLYVATLDLVVNQFGADPGHSNVWRVDPNADYPTKPKLWASGLTTVTACTFDRAGNFWGTEMFYPNGSGAPGDLVRIPFNDPTQLTHLGLGDIPLPGGITEGPDGAMYVSTNSAAPGPAGQVVRVDVK
jgi:glucose/arabinose dehydrogenase